MSLQLCANEWTLNQSVIADCRYDFTLIASNV